MSTCQGSDVHNQDSDIQTQYQDFEFQDQDHKSQNQKSITNRLKESFSRNRVMCSHKNDDLLIKIQLVIYSVIQQSTHDKDR